MTSASGFLDELWGFCGECERWRRSGEWADVDGPRCPFCGQRPLLIERLEEHRTTLSLALEVAVGPVGSRFFLES